MAVGAKDSYATITVADDSGVTVGGTWVFAFASGSTFVNDGSPVPFCGSSRKARVPRGVARIFVNLHALSCSGPPVHGTVEVTFQQTPRRGIPAAR